MKEKPCRVYRLRRVDSHSRETVQEFHEWLHPNQTNRERRETALARKYKAKLERMNPAQRRKLARSETKLPEASAQGTQNDFVIRCRNRAEEA